MPAEGRASDGARATVRELLASSASARVSGVGTRRAAHARSRVLGPSSHNLAQAMMRWSVYQRHRRAARPVGSRSVEHGRCVRATPVPSPPSRTTLRVIERNAAARASARRVVGEV